MKVFTVGLDQKPSQMEEGKQQQQQKSAESPPPGYSTTEARIPLPIGPELPRPPLPPHPIIVRKSRGYKGILLVMLSVFLMAIFALILSEMAYNRQRDENFFKLRWAELKHRMGYDNDGPFEYYQRAAASIGDKFDRLLSLAKSNEMPSSPIVPQRIVPQSLSEIEGDQQQSPSSSSITPAPAPTPEPVIEPDAFPLPIFPGGFPLSSSFSSGSVAAGSSSHSGSHSSSSSQASFEIEPPQPIFNSAAGLNGALNQIRDARLQFLRNILQKIKQHAEDIGFDGTMQVSIIEVEPQEAGDEQPNTNEAGSNGLMNNWQQRQQIAHQQFPPPPPPHFFPHARPLVEDFKNSRSFLDGFGEFHQPSFMQNNQLGSGLEQQEERPPLPPQSRMFGPWMLQQQQQQQPHDFQPPPPPPVMQQQPQQQQQQQPNMPDFMDNMRWSSPRINPFRPQPEMLFFHPIFPQQMSLRFPPPAIAPEWAQQQQQQQQQQNAATALMGALARPSAFDRWNMGAAAPQQQPMLPPQPQQIQIDLPEVKQPPPPPPPAAAAAQSAQSAAVVSNSNSDESAEDKFPVAPPQHNNQQQPPPPPPPVAQQPLQMQLPKWLIENVGGSSNNNAAGGPPGFAPPKPAEMVKFPSVTVLGAEQQQQPPSRVIAVADNEGNRAAVNAGQVLAEEKADAVVESSSSSMPDEVVEVDAAPQQSEQDNTKDKDNGKENSGKVEALKEEEQQQQPDDGPEQRPQQQQQQLPIAQMAPAKWFPEVPSVFFQVDDPIEQQMPAAGAALHPQQEAEKN